MKYKKKPVVIEAIRWQTFNLEEVQSFIGGPEYVRYHYDGSSLELYNVLEQCWVRCPYNHWIIRGIKGEIYPCENSVFEDTYEAVPDSETL